MDLSVIIVNWNTRELLASCLESLVGCLTQAGGSSTSWDARLRPLLCEVLVVDNASTDSSVQMVRDQFPQVILIENAENAGFAAANNQAIRRAHGRYLLMLNSDTQVYPGALDAMAQFMDSHPQAGGCGPLLLNTDGTLQVSSSPMLTPGREFWRLLFLDRVWRRATYDMSRWSLDAPREVEVLKGACLMLRRDALEQVGWLDPRYFVYTEEVDVCYRLRQDGWSLYWVPKARVVHHREGSTSQIADSMYVQLYRSKVQFFRKIGGGSQARLFKALLALAYLPRLIVATAGAPFIPALGGRARTFRRLIVELATM